MGSLQLPALYAAELIRAYKCCFIIAGGFIQSINWRLVGKRNQVAATPIVNIHPNGYTAVPLCE
jgi:hypothetical protein